MKVNFKFFLVSILIHAVFVFGMRSLITIPDHGKKESKTVFMEIEKNFSKNESTSSSKGLLGKTAEPSLKNLAPSFVNGLFITQSNTLSNTLPNDKLNFYGDAQALIRSEMTQDSKTTAGVNHLVAAINNELDFPEMLIENAIHGVSALEIDFDKNGIVLENSTQVTGGNYYVRGLLIKAVRRGLVSFYRSSQYTAKALKNYHFRATFEFLDTLTSNPNNSRSGVTRAGESSYAFLRRSKRATVTDCALESFSNFLCYPFLIAGAIKRSTSDRYKGKWAALQDELSHYDDLKLDGINEILSRI